MIKIEWLDSERVVPRVGLCETGRIYTVDDDIGRGLIRQNQAREVSETVIIYRPKPKKKVSPVKK